MEIENLTERIQMLINHFSKGSQTDFSKKARIPQSTLHRNLADRDNKLLMSLTGWILLAFPEVKREWLLTGEGEMLAEPKPDRPDRTEAETLRQEIAYLKELIRNKDEIIMLQRRLIADKPPTWE